MDVDDVLSLTSTTTNSIKSIVGNIFPELDIKYM